MPLTILRWPLAGALMSIVADAVDIILFQLYGFPSFGYHELDKLLDAYYLTLEVLVAQRWDSLHRITATVLFLWRMTGVLVFELTDARPALLVFPNLFENFFVFKLLAERFAPAYELTPRRTVLWLALLLVPKLVQEYILHDAKVLDDYVAVDIIRDAKDWLLP